MLILFTSFPLRRDVMIGSQYGTRLMTRV